MPMRFILLPFQSSAVAETSGRVAAALAKRFSAHVEAMFVKPDPVAIFQSMSTGLYITSAATDLIEQDCLEFACRCREAYTHWRTDRGLLAATPGQGASAGWSEFDGLPEDCTRRLGRVSDLIVLPRPGGSLDPIGHAALFGTGRPVLIVPPGPSPDLLSHVVIAWNGSLEASRAVALAMPLLQAADRVTIVSIAVDGDADTAASLARSLAWHGIRVDLAAPAGEGEGEGEALLRVAAACNAGLVVMGAYTHGPLRQRLLGGVTSHILQHADRPVLMAH